MERRHTRQPVKIETRDDGPTKIVGYGAVFHREGEEGTEYQLFEGAVERIHPNAFDRALKENHDARGLFNHDPSAVLGRVGAGTMRLSVDSVGLRYEIDAPDTQLAQDVVKSIERGDITGSSFAFKPTATEWTEEKDGPDVRTIRDVDLFDAGPVTFPAYESATTGVRDSTLGDEAEQEHQEWKRSQEKSRRSRFQKHAAARLIDLENETV